MKTKRFIGIGILFLALVMLLVGATVQAQDATATVEPSL